MTQFEPFAVVALLCDLPDKGLRRGQVGTVVELYSPADAEVEFVDDDGRTYALTTLGTADLLQLHHHPANKAA